MGYRILGSGRSSVWIELTFVLGLLLCGVAASAQSTAKATITCEPKSACVQRSSSDSQPHIFAGNMAARVGFDNSSAEHSGRGSDAAAVVIATRPTDVNRQYFYKNRLEFSIEGGMLPFNIPFPFDFLLGDGYNMTSLYYTLIPIMTSVRWQTNDIGGPSLLRGNWEMSFSALATGFPRGPETHYLGYVMGIRRNFVRPNWRGVPFAEFRAGLGGEDAKGPKGVQFAQGQDFAFTLMMDSGLRVRLTPKYSVWAGVQWMHISNLYMSEPRYLNYGINVYGPVVGLDMQIHAHKQVQ